jgi:hypothetical protein
MKKLNLLLLLGMLFCLNGCDITKRKNFILLIDNSISVPEEVMQRYIKTIQETILPNMGPKDKLIVEFIDACSQTQAERIYAFDLAEMDFTNKRDGVNHQNDSITQRLKRYLTITIRAEIAEAILKKHKERKGCGYYTDIINALNEANKLVETKKSYNSVSEELMNDAKGDENYQYENCIAIFSDMVNENKEGTFDFTTFDHLGNQAIQAKVKQLKELNKIPDLTGVKILVYGSTSTKETKMPGKQIENIKLFWDLFFKSAHAEVKGYGYDTQMEIKRYMEAD